jgi:hypothetical protein
VQTLRAQLKAQDIHDSWQTLRANGKTIHLRKATRAEPHQETIYHALGIPMQPGSVQKTVV